MMHKEGQPSVLNPESQSVPHQTVENAEKVTSEVVQVIAEFEYPEGGKHGWMTVLGGYVEASHCFEWITKLALHLPDILCSALVLFCTAGLSQSFGVFQDYYTVLQLQSHPLICTY